MNLGSVDQSGRMVAPRELWRLKRQGALPRLTQQNGSTHGEQLVCVWGECPQHGNLPQGRGWVGSVP